MARIKIKLDSGGIAEMLKSGEVAEAVQGLALDIADAADGWETSKGEPIPVKTSFYTTDRAAAAVTLAHPAGMPLQAKYGVLTDAAAQVGLEVRGR